MKVKGDIQSHDLSGFFFTTHTHNHEKILNDNHKHLLIGHIIINMIKKQKCNYLFCQMMS